jgi:hypothetical protein
MMKIKLSQLRNLIREAVSQMLSRQQAERSIEEYFSSLEAGGMAASEGIVFDFEGEDQTFLVGAIDRYNEDDDQSTIDYQIYGLDASGMYAEMSLRDLSDSDRFGIQDKAELQLV